MNGQRLRSFLLGGTAFAMVAGVSSTANAQDAGYGVNEIIVTAQKREQSIQDVPLAVTALGQDAIAVNRIEDAADLTGLAPGLVARNTAGALGSISFAMRGVNANPSAPLQDKQISMYIDGVYLGGARGTLSELMEVERIEVLRGPQGTLFGRNATAGAVSVVTRNPTGDMAFRQDVTVGNQGHFRTRTTIDTPAFGPFSAYVTYIHDQSRGDVRNLGAGVVWDRTNPFTNVGRQKSPKWVGGRNYENVFAALRYDNGGSVTASYKFEWSEGNFTGSARTTPIINAADPQIGWLLAAILAAQPPGGGAFGPVALNSRDRRPDAYNQAFSTRGFQKVQGHNLTVDWQVSDSVAVKNIFSFRKNRIFSGGSTIAGLSGLEFTPAAVPAYAIFAAASSTPGFATLPPDQQGAIIQQYAQGLLAQVNGANAQGIPIYFAPYEGQSYGKHWQVSDELQVNYTSDWLALTAGLMYYQSSSTDSGLPGFAPNIAFQPTSTTIALEDYQRANGKTKSYAAYTQAEFSVTPELGVVVGGRITKDDKRGVYQDQGAFIGNRTTGGEIVFGNTLLGNFKKTKFTWSAGVNYQPTNELLLYGKYSTGFLSGGSYADLIFPPETAKSWEVGFKSDWWDRRVRFNVAAYKVDYDNAQAATSGPAIGRPDLPIAVVTNGSLKSKGLEFELNVAPLPGLSFGGTAGYTKNKYVNPSPLLARGRDIRPTGQPRWVGSVNAMYVTRPLFGDATLAFRVDMTFQSKSRVLDDPDTRIVNPVFAPFEFIPPKQIVNARIALRDVDVGGANLELGLWSKNLFDNKKPLYPFQYPNFLMTTTYEPARTYGLDVIVKFNP